MPRPGQDQAFRHLEGWETGVEVVEPAPDHGRFDAAGLGAEALMVPVAPFQGDVNEEPEDGLGSVFRVCADSGRPWPLPCGRTFSASKSAVLLICLVVHGEVDKGAGIYGVGPELST